MPAPRAPTCIYSGRAGSESWSGTEIGIVVAPEDLRHVHTLHVHTLHVHTLHVNDSGPEPRLGLFEARRWVGEPTNREPGKCSAVSWFAVDALPEQLIAYPAAGIDAYRADVTFSVQGWTWPADPTGMALGVPG